VRTTRLAGLITAGALLLTIAGPVSADSTAMVRVLHASPDAPAVDVWVDGAQVLQNVPFKGISGYLKVPAGTPVNIKVVATGTTTPAVIDASPTFDAGKKYTVAAIGFLSSIEPKVIEDNGKGVDGSSQLRVIHLSPDAPAVDVALKGQDPDQAPVKNLAYKEATGYLTLKPASYDFEVRLAGTTTVALALDGVALSGGTNYTAFAVGSANAEAPAGQELAAVLGVDGIYAPATDTVETGSGLALLLLGAAAVFGLIASRRFATARAAR
jgi:hypothetical protein